MCSLLQLLCITSQGTTAASGATSQEVEVIGDPKTRPGQVHSKWWVCCKGKIVQQCHSTHHARHPIGYYCGFTL